MLATLEWNGCFADKKRFNCGLKDQPLVLPIATYTITPVAITMNSRIAITTKKKTKAYFALM